MSCSLIGKTPFFGNGLYQFESGQLSNGKQFNYNYFILIIFITLN